MPKVFVSWYDGHNHVLASDFFRLLEEHSFEAECSPFSPESGFYDSRWADWYKEGLPKAISRADVFVAVITPSCDGSTWMLQEFEEAYSNFMKTGKPKLYFIRFDSIEKVKYPEHYLQNSVLLSSTPNEAVRTLLTYNS